MRLRQRRAFCQRELSHAFLRGARHWNTKGLRTSLLEMHIHTVNPDRPEFMHLNYVRWHVVTGLHGWKRPKIIHRYRSNYTNRFSSPHKTGELIDDFLSCKILKAIVFLFFLSEFKRKYWRISKQWRFAIEVRINVTSFSDILKNLYFDDLV